MKRLKQYLKKNYQDIALKNVLVRVWYDMIIKNEHGWLKCSGSYPVGERKIYDFYRKT